MKRFLMLVAVAAVAGAMYVAASPASQQSKGPTLKQFTALKKQVATLSKKLKTIGAEADAVGTIVGACYLTVNGGTVSFEALPVSQRGTNTTGYLFGTSLSSAPTTALDVDTASPHATLQEVDPACLAAALRHGAVHSATSRLERLAAH